MQYSEACSDLYIGERPRQDKTLFTSASKGHSFKDATVPILEQEGRWIDREVKEAITEQREWHTIPTVSHLQCSPLPGPKTPSDIVYPVSRSHDRAQQGLIVFSPETSSGNDLFSHLGSCNEAHD